ncbi:hypothetical protein SAMN04487769_0478 [Burkholderia sp. b14]|nr:hypothetical protein SAMN04487769_0478 [Burkholderia sp. b14]
MCRGREPHGTGATPRTRCPNIRIKTARSRYSLRSERTAKIRVANNAAARACRGRLAALSSSGAETAALLNKLIDALHEVGLTKAEILDLSHAIAIFAWANRLMLTLGEPVFPA